MKNKITSILSDFFYNIISSLISTGVIQLVLYPTLANSLSTDEYGKFLTIISIINVITLSLGNNLATTRLIKNVDYQDKKIIGDFNFLLLLSVLVNYLILYIYNNIEFRLSFIEFNYVALASSLTIIRTYLSVAYRLRIDYKKNLILNVILAIGFILGSRLFANYNYWPVIYIISNVLAIIYIILTSNLFRESFKLTINFRNTLKSYLFLILSGFIGNLTTYLDKIIIYPVLGAASVSVFSVASFF